MRSQIILMTLIALCVSVYSDVKDCGSELGELIEMTVSGCPNLKERCVIYRGTNVTVTLKFKTNANIEQVKPLVYVELFEVPFYLAPLHPDGCTDSGLECPLKSHETYIYTGTFYIAKYPKLDSITAVMELLDEKEEDILCMEFPAKLE